LTSNRTWLGFRQWKTRWAVLREDTISYYENNMAGTKEKGTIPLSVVQFAANNPETKTWGFTVCADHEDPQLCWEFAAKSMRERDDWVTAIQDILANSHGKDRRRTTTTGQTQDFFGDRVTFHDFHITKKLGDGGTAQVYNCTREVPNCNGGDPTFEDYAIKIVNKAALSEAILLAASSELGIMSHIKAIEHSYIVKLHYCFEHDDKLYLVMDRCVTDMFDHLGASQGSFSHLRSRHYAAEIGLALWDLHELGFVHCDMKPENLLIDADGHAMLADFGFTQRIELDDDDGPQRGLTLCYTPPEILAGSKPDSTTDFWGLGCIIYEFHTGLPPFYAKDNGRMKAKILAGVVEPHPEVNEVALDLILKCLDPSKDTRVSGEQGLSREEFMAHPYFESMDWELLARKGIPIPQ